MKKKLLYLVLILLCCSVLLSALTACGNTDSTGTTSQSEQTPSDPSDDQDDTTSSNDKNDDTSSTDKNDDSSSTTGGDNVDPPAHEHTYADAWSKDETHHWHAATCGHADEKKDYAEHDFGAENICTVCSYTLNLTPTEELEYSLNEDKTGYIVTGIGSVSATDIVIPDTYLELPVVEIGGKAFSDCTSLTGITIPDSVTSIGNMAFFNSYNLAAVYITDLEAWCNIRFDGPASNPLSNAYKLYLNDVLMTDLVIPNGITSIGDYAFYHCESLTTISIPNSVTSIGCSAFEGCRNLVDIAIPNRVTNIGDEAFSDCRSLTNITIPNSTTSIGHKVLYGCFGLTSITVAAGNPTYHSGGNCLIETASKTLITGCTNSIIPIDGSVELIGNGAFYGYSGLTSITIPDGVTTIDDLAFYRCGGLTILKLPHSVTSIGDYAFDYCYGLNIIYYTGNPTEWSNITIGFSNVGISSATIYYYSETEPTDTENLYWHYVDGVPTAW